jgi:hypothetical protein
MTTEPTRQKGRAKNLSPEKMSSITSGIEMTRGTRPADREERLASGQEVADEREVAEMVMAFIRNEYDIKPKG